MATTTTQEQQLRQYLQDVASHLDGLPPQARRDEILRIRMRLEKDLNGLNGIRPVEEVDALLQRLSAPEERPLWASRRRSLRLSQDDVLWAGVCGGIGEHLDVRPGYVRFAFIVFGLLTGPIALLAYLVMFAYLRAGTPPDTQPPVSIGRVALSAGSVAAAAFAVYAVARFFTAILLHAYATVLASQQMVLAERWTWFVNDNGHLLAWALCSTVPLAILGALPLRGGWDETLSRVARAGIAVYGIIAAYGLACLFVGVVLGSLEQVAGISLSAGQLAIP